MTAEEAALWAKVAKTVERYHPLQDGEGDQPQAGEEAPRTSAAPARKPPPPPPPRAGGLPLHPGEDSKPRSPLPLTLDRHGLDAGWDRRLSRGLVAPDFTLDLHGFTIEAAHGRLEHGLTFALQQGARVVLLITGRERPSDDRRSRGAIRRKFMDWLAAGSHASRIAAVRGAHPRHGGAGAVYIVLKRMR